MGAECIIGFTSKRRELNMTQSEIKFALNDIKETLAIYTNSPQNDYTRKLWAEWDFLVSKLEA